MAKELYDKAFKYLSQRYSKLFGGGGEDDRPRGLFTASNEHAEFLIQVARYSGVDIDELRDKSIEARYDLMLSFVGEMDRRRKEIEQQNKR